jgi:hypothetical protein
MTELCHSSDRQSGDPHPGKHKVGTTKYNIDLSMNHQAVLSINFPIFSLFFLDNTSQLSAPCFVPQGYLLKVHSIDNLLHHLPKHTVAVTASLLARATMFLYPIEHGFCRSTFDCQFPTAPMMALCAESCNGCIEFDRAEDSGCHPFPTIAIQNHLLDFVFPACW